MAYKIGNAGPWRTLGNFQSSSNVVEQNVNVGFHRNESSFKVKWGSKRLLLFLLFRSYEPSWWAAMKMSIFENIDLAVLWWTLPCHIICLFGKQSKMKRKKKKKKLSITAFLCVYILKHVENYTQPSEHKDKDYIHWCAIYQHINKHLRLCRWDVEKRDRKYIYSVTRI